MVAGRPTGPFGSFDGSTTWTSSASVCGFELEAGSSICSDAKTPPDSSAGASSGDESPGTVAMDILTSCGFSVWIVSIVGSKSSISRACFSLASVLAARASANGNSYASSGRGKRTSAALILWINTLVFLPVASALPPGFGMKVSRGTARTSPVYL